MDKAQQQLIKTYYRKRGIAIQQNSYYGYKPYEYTRYALDNNIIDLKPLSIGQKYNIFKNNPKIKEYIAPYLDAYDKKAQGLLKLLLEYQSTGDKNNLINFITNSDFYKNNGQGIDISSYGIEIIVDSEVMINKIGLENDYNYIKHYASSYFEGDTADSDELNYMWNNLNTVNKEKIKKIATIIGYDKEKINNFDDEGVLNKFFDEYKFFENLTSTYLNEYGYLTANAEHKVAEEQLENFPLDIDNNETIIVFDNIYNFIYDNDLSNIETFDNFLYELESNNNIDIDKISENALYNFDSNELNYQIENVLNDILEGFEDENSDYYGYVEGRKELDKYMQYYKFIIVNEKYIAYKKETDKTIFINDYKFDTDNNELLIDVSIDYYNDKVRRGWMNIKNLKNYIGQQSISGMTESNNYNHKLFINMNIKNIITEEIQNLVERQEGIYTIPELAEILKAYDNVGDREAPIYEKLLFAAFQDGGDEKVEKVYKHYTGTDIEHISKGRYMFKRLVNPDKEKQARQDAKYYASDSEYGVAPKKFARENQDRFV